LFHYPQISTEKREDKLNRTGRAKSDGLGSPQQTACLQIICLIYYVCVNCAQYPNGASDNIGSLIQLERCVNHPRDPLNWRSSQQEAPEAMISKAQNKALTYYNKKYAETARKMTLRRNTGYVIAIEMLVDGELNRSVIDQNSL
jgi:hypothetical protein